MCLYRTIYRTFLCDLSMKPTKRGVDDLPLRNVSPSTSWPQTPSEFIFSLCPTIDLRDFSGRPADTIEIMVCRISYIVLVILYCEQ